MNETEIAATDLGTPVNSFPTVKTSEVQHNKTETDSVKKPEDQNISSFMFARSPVLNRNETFSSGMNLTSDPQKIGEISKAVNFPQATLVSPVPPIYILTYFHSLLRRILWHVYFLPYISYVF